MKFKDYYETLGVSRNASADGIKAAYRRLARKYHPDVSKEQNAEARFKELGEAHEVLKDPEKRALYDKLGSQWKAGQDFKPEPGWDAGFEWSGGPGADSIDPNDFFEAFFGRQSSRGSRRRAVRAQGEDHHAKVMIDVEDSYRGAKRTVTLRISGLDSNGRMASRDHTLEVAIPRGVMAGQHLRLAGQGGPGRGGGAAGDLYLEIGFLPHRRFRVEGRDIYVDLRVTPWEAALGAKVTAPTPEGPVELSVPPGSSGGRKLRLKGRGLPGTTPGDLYVVLSIALPPADSEKAQGAYREMAKAFDFNPRSDS